MNNSIHDKSEPLLKTTLTFFNNKLTVLNNNRLLLNRGKNLAKFLAKSKTNIRDIGPFETTLGVMSFSLYMLRLSTNLGLLIELMLSKPHYKTDMKTQRDLYYILINDSIWSVVNLIQFFWLSYRKSISAGLRGMQLETVAQIIDLLVLITRYQDEKKEYELKYAKAKGFERVFLEAEWHHKELNLIRSLLTGLAMTTLFGLFSFSIIATPISPIIAPILLINSLIRILIDINKDKELIHQLKLEGTNMQMLQEQEQLMTGSRLNDLNQLVLGNVFVPLGIFLLITATIPLFTVSSLVMLATYYLLNHILSIYASHMDIHNHYVTLAKKF